MSYACKLWIKNCLKNYIEKKSLPSILAQVMAVHEGGDQACTTLILSDEQFYIQAELSDEALQFFHEEGVVKLSNLRGGVITLHSYSIQIETGVYMVIQKFSWIGSNGCYVFGDPKDINITTEAQEIVELSRKGEPELIDTQSLLMSIADSDKHSGQPDKYSLMEEECLISESQENVLHNMLDAQTRHSLASCSSLGNSLPELSQVMENITPEQIPEDMGDLYGSQPALEILIEEHRKGKRKRVREVPIWAGKKRKLTEMESPDLFPPQQEVLSSLPSSDEASDVELLDMVDVTETASQHSDNEDEENGLSLNFFQLSESEVAEIGEQPMEEVLELLDEVEYSRKSKIDSHQVGAKSTYSEPIQKQNMSQPGETTLESVNVSTESVVNVSTESIVNVSKSSTPESKHSGSDLGTPSSSSSSLPPSGVVNKDNVTTPPHLDESVVPVFSPSSDTSPSPAKHKEKQSRTEGMRFIQTNTFSDTALNLLQRYFESLRTPPKSPPISNYYKWMSTVHNSLSKSTKL